MVTRRRFLRVSGAGAITGSALLAGACGDDSGPAPRTKDDADVADVEVLNGVLDLELKSIAARIGGELEGGNVVFLIPDDGWKYLSSGVYTKPIEEIENLDSTVWW